MKRLFILLLLSVTLLTSCTMQPTIPENDGTFTQFLENKELYNSALECFSKIDYDAMVSRNDYYSIKGSESFENLYLQNMQDQSISEYSEKAVLDLFQFTNVKLIDWIRRDELKICTFDMCIPGKNFDYGIYYTSGDDPIYFGDPSIELSPSGNGFSYEKKASYGAKFTYYTEKIEDHFYYYEIA